MNNERAPAYTYGPEHKLAQLAATGTLQDNYYCGAEAQLADVLDAANRCDPEFVAKAAVYARSRGAMKDMPALLAAWLTVADPDLSIRVFDRVIDNGRMLRNFVQIMRSGMVGRSSLGSRPKRLVQLWLERASMRTLMQAATGKRPDLRRLDDRSVRRRSLTPELEIDSGRKKRRSRFQLSGTGLIGKRM
jgi:60 kDa SS-A/Ro ribonucleoprotein